MGGTSSVVPVVGGGRVGVALDEGVGVAVDGRSLLAVALTDE